MVILKYELKRHRKYILGWAIALALCVFVMTPTYYSFMDVSTGDLYETLGTSDFYKGVGVSMEYLTSPLGIYAFLTSFFMIASGIFGMHFGIAIHTKECSERTSEYLFTKPHTRKTIYWAKAFTVFFGVVVVSMVYLLASFLALALFRSGIDWGEFFLIAHILKEKQALGIEVTIVTWEPDDYGFGDAAFWMQLHEDMRQAGFFIKTVEDSCENFAIIDQEIIWYGNIHLLGREKVEDNIMRVKDKKIADELLELAFK